MRAAISFSEPPSFLKKRRRLFTTRERKSFLSKLRTRVMLRRCARKSTQRSMEGREPRYSSITGGAMTALFSEPAIIVQRKPRADLLAQQRRVSHAHARGLDRARVRRPGAQLHQFLLDEVHGLHEALCAESVRERVDDLPHEHYHVHLLHEAHAHGDVHEEAAEERVHGHLVVRAGSDCGLAAQREAPDAAVLHQLRGREGEPLHLEHGRRARRQSAREVQHRRPPGREHVRDQEEPVAGHARDVESVVHDLVHSAVRAVYAQRLQDHVSGSVPRDREVRSCVPAQARHRVRGQTHGQARAVLRGEDLLLVALLGLLALARAPHVLDRAQPHLSLRHQTAKRLPHRRREHLRGAERVVHALERVRLQRVAEEQPRHPRAREREPAHVLLRELGAVVDPRGREGVVGGEEVCANREQCGQRYGVEEVHDVGEVLAHAGLGDASGVHAHVGDGHPVAGLHDGHADVLGNGVHRHGPQQLAKHVAEPALERLAPHEPRVELAGEVRDHRKLRVREVVHVEVGGGVHEDGPEGAGVGDAVSEVVPGVVEVLLHLAGADALERESLHGLGAEHGVPQPVQCAPHVVDAAHLREHLDGVRRRRRRQPRVHWRYPVFREHALEETEVQRPRGVQRRGHLGARLDDVLDHLVRECRVDVVHAARVHMQEDVAHVVGESLLDEPDVVLRDVHVGNTAAEQRVVRELRDVGRVELDVSGEERAAAPPRELFEQVLGCDVLRAEEVQVRGVLGGHARVQPPREVPGVHAGEHELHGL
ncbi:PP147 [Orf virus]|uniref:PP147 n=1 Tax=Orf virus TaxID=10258 RepID=F1AWW1_ORFV|nr:PP147 [Orf virus]